MKKLFWSYTIILILLAVLPINGGESVINHTFIISIRLDYLIHFAIYIPWMVILWKMTGANFRNNTGRSLLYILFALLFAIANEGIQYVLPYRAFNINDLLANGLGVMIGAVVFLR